MKDIAFGMKYAGMVPNIGQHLMANDETMQDLCGA